VERQWTNYDLDNYGSSDHCNQVKEIQIQKSSQSRYHYILFNFVRRKSRVKSKNIFSLLLNQFRLSVSHLKKSEFESDFPDLDDGKKRPHDLWSKFGNCCHSVVVTTWSCVTVWCQMSVCIGQSNCHVEGFFKLVVHNWNKLFLKKLSFLCTCVFMRILFNLCQVLKVRWFRKDFLVSSISPKKRTNEFIIVVKTNSFVRFLGEFEDTKSPFETIWPLTQH
jgi:hypothetical protein